MTSRRLEGALRGLMGRGSRLTRGSRRTFDALTLPRFAALGPGFEMQRPRSIVNADRIRIGRDVKLGPGSELKANTRFPGGWMKHPEGKHVEQTFDPRIRIGDRVTATSALQVAAFQEVDIGDDVMFAANVFVSDGSHAFERADVPYKFQGISKVAPVRIGNGSWIGQNVVIMPGVTIGAFVVIGSNSVVTRDIPSHSIASGAPARVRRTWSAATASWHDTHSAES